MAAIRRAERRRTIDVASDLGSRPRIVSSVFLGVVFLGVWLRGVWFVAMPSPYRVGVTGRAGPIDAGLGVGNGRRR